MKTQLISEVWGAVCIGVVSAMLETAFPFDAGVSLGPPSETAKSDVSQNHPTNRLLAETFIRWYETQYVNGMRTVADTSTDIGDLVDEVGIEKAVDRCAAFRRINLDYAIRFPDRAIIPAEDLERLAEAQYEHFVANTRSSKKWINYRAPKLREGLVDTFKQASLIWIPFYQRLLHAPPTAPDADPRDLMSTLIPKEEYVRTINTVVQLKITFHDSLKYGVSWYSPSRYWVKSRLDRVCKQDIELCRATVVAIYGGRTFAGDDRSREGTR